MSKSHMGIYYFALFLELQGGCYGYFLLWLRLLH